MPSKRPSRAGDRLLRLLAEAGNLAAVDALLSWDQETHMPSGGAERRSEMRALLSTLSHRLRVSPEMGEALSALSTTRNISSRMSAVLRKAARDYRIARCLPEEHVREMARTASVTQGIWIEARRKNNFRLVESWLEKIVRLKRRECEYLGYEEHPYDALLDLYEPGARAEGVAAIFHDLRQGLTPLIPAARSRGSSPAVDLRIAGKGEEEALRSFCHNLLLDMGFSFERGRCDTSEHPFAMGLHPGDVRFTVRRRPADCLDSVFSTLHEGGHALYEQGLTARWPGTALGEAASVGVHESQSRMWENLVGRSRGFWRAYLPALRKRLPRLVRGMTLSEWLLVVNRVRPTLIRVDADEVTYNLHIMLRFELEKDLIAGRIAVRETPEIWRRRMKEYLGVEPRDPASGCLQDVHWYCGDFGYFPSYALGNLYAAQFYAEFERQTPAWPANLAKGNLLPLKSWLNSRIHRHGACYPAEDLVRRVTGRKLSVEPFLDYLRKKYLR